MSEATRARRTFLQNRIAELNAKYGPVADEPLPPWLDSIEGYRASVQAQEPPIPDEPPEWWADEPAPQNRVLEASGTVLPSTVVHRA